jgi:hypothetical protein
MESLSERALRLARDNVADDQAVAELTELLQATPPEPRPRIGWFYFGLDQSVRAALARAIADCSAAAVDGAVRERAIRWLTEVLRQLDDTPAVTTRVRRAFGDASMHAYAADYAQAVHANVKDLAEGMRRSALLLVVTAIAFELINQAAIAGAQIGPFQVRDLSLVQKALPVMSAYLAYDAVSLGLRYVYSWQVYQGILRLTHEPVWLAWLDTLLRPPTSSLLGPPPLALQAGGRLDRLAFMLSRGLRSVALGSSVVVEAYMFVRLFQRFGPDDIVLWASAALSAGFFVYAGVLYLVGLRAAR